MKAKLYIIAALIATALTAVAQTNNKDQRTRWMNEVRNQKYEFIINNFNAVTLTERLTSKFIEFQTHNLSVIEITDFIQFIITYFRSNI